MRQHHIKTAVRRLFRQRGPSLINVLGLSTGLAACLLLFLFVRYEEGYDAYNTNGPRIVRVTTLVHTPESDLHIAGTPGLLGAALLRDCPDVATAVRIEPATFNLRSNGETVAAENFFYSEASIFTVFSFTFLEGSAATALTEPHSIVLTRSSAIAYFGKGPVVGKTLFGDGETYRVTAVIADRPANSDLSISALLYKDWASLASWTGGDFDVYTYLLFRGIPDIRGFNSRLPLITRPQIQPELDRAGLKGYTFTFEAERLADVHFSKGKLADTPKGNSELLTIFSWLAVFILLVALLNYINLSTATAMERAKEVAVRKVVGARPIRLIRQFLAESAFLIAIAWALSLGIVLAVLPVFNRLLHTSLAFEGWRPLLFPVLLFPLTTLLAGGYPALVLSRWSALKVLKGHSEGAGRGVGMRKVFTVIQFVIALAMLTGTVVIYRQTHFLSHQDLGADRTGVVRIGIPADPAARAAAPAFFQALRQEAGIKGVSVGSGIPSEGFQLASIVLWKDGKERRLMLNLFDIDPQLLPLLNIKLVAGRNFSDSLETDRREGWIVNRALVRAMGWKTGIGESISYEGSGVKGKVIGVVDDFYYKSFHNVIEPMAMIDKPDPPPAVLVKTSRGEMPWLHQLWRSYFPAFAFDYSFMEENFDKQYAADRTAMALFNTFTGLAVFVGLIGLFGLVSLVVGRRTRELAIRKVLGATVLQLVRLIGRDLLWLVLVAGAIGLPLAGIGATKWLATYAYHVNLAWWVFAAPVGMILLLMMGVAGYRIVRAAMASPVVSLRSEG